jgi:serine/threonine protein kinase
MALETEEDTLLIHDHETETSRTIAYDDISKVYIFGPVIGKGRFGEVRVAQRISLGNSQKFAIKSIPRQEVDEEFIRCFIRELDILKVLDHPNIIDFHEIYVDKHYFHIVMELCYGMNLFDYVQKYKRLEEKQAAVVIKQVLKGIKYLHE